MEMLPKIKIDFPELYTKTGKLRKKEPYRFKCDCGNEFNKKTATGRNLVMTFATSRCKLCGSKAKETAAYNVWKRMINNQIEQEDFILKVVSANPFILRERLETIVESVFQKDNNTLFKKDVNALGHLVYFGYIKVNEHKRDVMKVIEYTINENKELSKRYERIS
jgi:hypothetical protein